VALSYGDAIFLNEWLGSREITNEDSCGLPLDFAF
jgi:hypothetical protein